MIQSPIFGEWIDPLVKGSSDRKACASVAIGAWMAATLLGQWRIRDNDGSWGAEELPDLRCDCKKMLARKNKNFHE